MKYLATIIMILILIFGGCNIIGGNCDDFKDSYRIVDINRSLKSISYNSENEVDFTLSEITNDEIFSDQYAINIDPIEEYYKSTTSSTLTLGGNSVVYACSPPLPTTEAIIKDIIITSDEDFNQEFPADSDFRGLFDIITVREGEGNKMQTLTQFLETPSMVPNNIVLVLNQAPETSKNISFYVALEFENVGYRYFSFATSYISIAPSN